MRNVYVRAIVVPESWGIGIRSDCYLGMLADGSILTAPFDYFNRAKSTYHLVFEFRSIVLVVSKISVASVYVESEITTLTRSA